MSKLAAANAVYHLMSPTVIAFVAPNRWNWFRRKRSNPPVLGLNPLSLVALADLEVAAGHEDQAKRLVEAAYIAFDYKL